MVGVAVPVTDGDHGDGLGDIVTWAAAAADRMQHRVTESQTNESPSEMGTLNAPSSLCTGTVTT